MATQSLPNDDLYSLEQYLDLDDSAEYKSEFHSGYIVAMAGGSEVHSRLSSRMGSLLDRYLRNCRTYDSNLKLYIEQVHRVVYPDAMALGARVPTRSNHTATRSRDPGARNLRPHLVTTLRYFCFPTATTTSRNFPRCSKQSHLKIPA